MLPEHVNRLHPALVIFLKIKIMFKGINFKAIYNDCSNEYGLFNYLEGPLNNKSISGNSMDFDNCGGSGEGPEMCLTKRKFSIQFLKDSTKLKYNNQDFSLTKMSYIFETKVQNLLSDPLKSSFIDGNAEGTGKIISESYDHNGEVKNCEPNGKGEMHFKKQPSGENIHLDFKGDFKDGEINGKGRMDYIKGDTLID